MAEHRTDGVTFHRGITDGIIENVGVGIFDIGELVLVIAKGKRGAPPEIPGLDVSAVERKLYSSVIHLSIVEHHLIPSQCRVGISVGQQVYGVLAVKVDASREAVFQDREVDAQVQGLGLLPSQRGIGRILDGGAKVGHPAVVFQRVEGEIRPGILRHVTSDTIGEAEGQVVEPCHILHKILLLGMPASTERP